MDTLPEEKKIRSQKIGKFLVKNFKQNLEKKTMPKNKLLDEIEDSADLYKKGYDDGYRDAKLNRKKIPHETMDGWCCACDYDQGTFQQMLKKALGGKK